MAAGLDLMAIATGIDSEQRRARLAGMGCSEGLGDLYADELGSTAETSLLEQLGHSRRVATSS